MPALFIGASLNNIIPPQSPGFLTVVALLEVNTIGFFSVPSAIILAPLVITSVPQVISSPLITVPASIVKVALLVTYTVPSSR